MLFQLSMSCDEKSHKKINYSKMLRDPNLGLGNTGTFKLNSDSSDIAGVVAIVEPET